MSRHVTAEQTPFAQVPEAVLFDRRLTDKAVRIYACLLRHGSDPANCYPSHKRIASLIGCSPRSVQAPLSALEEAGWIERVVRWNPDGSRTSDGFFVRVQSSAPPAQESADPPRSRAR